MPFEARLGSLKPRTFRLLSTTDNERMPWAFFPPKRCAYSYLNIAKLHACSHRISRADTALRTLEIEDVILFFSQGVADLLNRPNAIMTRQGGSRAHIRKCEPAIPDNPAPTRNPDHTLASIRARAK
jgi:hypothetical protein